MIFKVIILLFIYHRLFIHHAGIFIFISIAILQTHKLHTNHEFKNVKKRKESLLDEVQTKQL